MVSPVYIITPTEGGLFIWETLSDLNYGDHSL